MDDVEITIVIIEKCRVEVHPGLLHRAKKFAIAPGFKVYVKGAMGKMFDTVNYHAMSEAMKHHIPLISLKRWE